ncbi:MAG: sterol desaturase family protein [Bacteroidetes bacterium]|nr:sterol desaturase family protein [Bacteroidota bacterium]
MRGQLGNYGIILMYIIPVFLLFVFLEKTYAWYFKKEPFKQMDLISSLSAGFSNAVKDALGIVFVIVSYGFMVSKLAVFEIKSTPLLYITGFIILDFYGYCTHRLAHSINFFWNKHAIHHSSEEFNLACALRQPVAQFVNLFTFILLPAAILGIPGQVIAIITPVHFFLQFWYHTVHIGKLGFLENIIVTPSHHRVHHAINPIYLDKNHSQIFIIWDKLFGTFQEELDEVPPVYGITRPMKTWNPIRINFKHLTLLVQDAIHTNSWKNKLLIWFKPTGWRPDDVIEKYPVEKIENPYQYIKYQTSSSPVLMFWLWIQLTVTLVFMYHLFANLAEIGKPDIFIYGGFVILQIYAYTELMDASKEAFVWDLVKLLAGMVILIYFKGWFNATGIYIALVSGYLFLSSLVTYYFTSSDKNRIPLKALEI